MRPKVSVIMPAYNGEKTIEDSVCSVLSQTFSEFELIIINDCSTDNTLRQVYKIAEEDSRIKIYTNQENLGVAETRNTGISLASGDYISFIDSDDIWVKEKLELQLDYLNKTGADLCYSSYEFINIYGERIGHLYKVPLSITYKQLLCENVIGCSTVLIKKEILPTSPFTSKYFHEDYVLWLKLLKDQKSAVGINKPLVQYRVGGRSSNKINAAYHRWKIYRNEEKLSFLVSVYYLSAYAFNGLNKAIMRNLNNSHN